MAWCQAEALDYLPGAGGKRTLEAEIQNQMKQAEVKQSNGVLSPNDMMS
jgi:hypothetical protein